MKKFAEKYKKQFGKEPNFAAQIGYTGAQLVVQALKNAGKDLTADSFVAGMESIKDWHDIFGSPPMTLQRDQAPGIERVVPVRGEGRQVGAGQHDAGRLLIRRPCHCEEPSAKQSRGSYAPPNSLAPPREAGRLQGLDLQRKQRVRIVRLAAGGTR